MELILFVGNTAACKAEDYSNVKSQTVPDDALSIRDILTRYTRGVPVKVLTDAQYQDENDDSVIDEYGNDYDVEVTAAAEELELAKTMKQKQTETSKDDVDDSGRDSKLDNIAPTDTKEE